jgi:octaprenyl-diphosphate synthase
MSVPLGNVSLANKEERPAVTIGLTELAEIFGADLERVRALISGRVFKEESFAELLIATGAEGQWAEKKLPDWLRKIVGSDGKPVSSVPKEMGRHLMSRGGKMFRATLILAIVKALSPEEKKGPELAAAMELIHLATLVHDDVIDRADIRRGAASLPSLYDNAPTVLMGDHLFARAFELIAECDNMGIISSSCRATSAMCRGEIEQLQWVGKTTIPEGAYYRLIEMKTAALMASCTESAALLCGRQEEADDWYRFGLSLGLVFQITDDLLDFIAEESVLGKKVGGDVAEGKYTLPLIVYRECSEGGALALRDLLDTAESRSSIREVLEEKGIFDEVRDRIRELARSCHDRIDLLAEKSDQPESFDPVHRLVEFVVSRNH